MPTRMSSAERRELLIRVALHQFAQQGVDATTRTSLAEELGVDRVIVHRLYPELDELVSDVIAHVRDLATTLVDDAAAAADEAPTIDEQWQAFLETIVAAARSNPDAWRFVYVTPTGAGAASRIAGLRAEIAERVTGELLTRAEPAGFDTTTKEFGWGTTFLYEGLFGAIAHHLEHGRARDDDRFVAYLGDMVGRMVEAPDVRA